MGIIWQGLSGMGQTYTHRCGKIKKETSINLYNWTVNNDALSVYFHWGQKKTISLNLTWGTFIQCTVARWYHFSVLIIVITTAAILIRISWQIKVDSPCDYYNKTSRFYINSYFLSSTCILHKWYNRVMWPSSFCLMNPGFNMHAGYIVCMAILEITNLCQEIEYNMWAHRVKLEYHCSVKQP